MHACKCGGRESERAMFDLSQDMGCGFLQVGKGSGVGEGQI